VPSVAGYTARIKVRLELRACWFESFPFDRQLPRLEADRVVLPATEPGLVPYADWAPEHGIELTVCARGHTLGRFVLVSERPTCGVAFPIAARRDAVEIAREAGDAVARHWIESDFQRGIHR
jgi:hypothetical protein